MFSSISGRNREQQKRTGLGRSLSSRSIRDFRINAMARLRVNDMPITKIKRCNGPGKILNREARNTLGGQLAKARLKYL